MSNRSSSAGQGSISIDVIQTDAAINPGNSGGALATTIATGTATHGQLSLSARDKASGTSSGFTAGAGAEVSAVTAGSAAAKAGLKAGDVITDLGGRSVNDASELTAAAREQAAGTTVKVTFQSGGTQQTADVSLGAATAG